MKIKNIVLKMFPCVVIFILLSLNFYVSAELFTSTSSLEDLVHTMDVVTKNLEAYFKFQQSTSHVLKKYSTLFKNEYDRAMDNIPEYIGNPIDIVKLALRLTNDLTEVMNNINANIELSIILSDSLSESHLKLPYNNNDGFYMNIEPIQDLWQSSITHVTLTQEYKKDGNLSFGRDLLLPDEDDLVGAVIGLMRLKDTYNLTNEELSKGVINSVTYSPPMTLRDCYKIGALLGKSEDEENAIEWMLLALGKFNNGEMQDENVKIDHIINHLISNYYYLGDIDQSLYWTKELISIGFGDEETYKLKDFLEKETMFPTGKPVQRPNKNENLEDFNKICRDELMVPLEIAKRLKCYFRTETHPFLTIAPIKTEQMYDVPEIVLFHDIISDKENEEIIFLAKKERLHRSEVSTSPAFPTIADYRISKQTWLSHETNNVTMRIIRRLQMATGYNQQFSEKIQVANYGIGGHYEPHYDFTTTEDDEDEDGGNRIATVLFYLSTVELGGGTAFPYLGLHLKPVKNSAAFWQNLHPSCYGDLSVLHGACPVLKGSKWVSTVWIRTIGQELIKPCTTEFQQESFIRRQPLPELRIEF